MYTWLASTCSQPSTQVQIRLRFQLPSFDHIHSLYQLKVNFKIELLDCIDFMILWISFVISGSCYSVNFIIKAFVLLRFYCS